MIVYAFLIRLLSPILLLWILVEAVKRHGGLRFIQQRLGIAYPTFSNTAIPPTWIHCASVGEVNAIAPLVKALLPNQPIIITTHTPTGAKQCDHLFGSDVTHCYLPLDWTYAVKQFLKRLSPNCLWVVETEIWPNLYRLSHQAGLPIVLINARLSRKTLNSPQWLIQTYQQTLSLVDKVILRSPEEAEHFQQLGVPTERIQFIENLKYAMPVEPSQLDNPFANRLGDSEFVVAASTHEDEEAQLVAIWQRLNRPEPLVFVPRHPHRRDAILKRLAGHRSEIAVDSLGDPITSQTRYILMDKMGVLMPLYTHAKLVIMGGAFVPKGGHNLIEPASVKACIITGPDMSDFETETQQLLAHKAIKQLHNWRQLEQTLTELLDNPTIRQQMGQAAYDEVTSKSSVLSDYLDALRPFQTRKIQIK
ncbi:3-deoxy-D-manno-octulosonic acid transferase [Hydrogenovibrio sp. SC-1]|uniref:3-deoxy-D-manno-octulosonic acid transferase n=1 Tax=Hydrogenovibrio sp. SC-1 TaxID=2065820 RepID=UPI001E3AAAAC|nr:3-deoxy-D-manno-octulosonic acid transferase [Hydrogenovibrio sp. SC-1]